MIFDICFKVHFLTQPPQSFLVDLKTINPMDSMEIWPKNKTPKKSPLGPLKVPQKKMATLRFLLPFQVRSFSLESCCSFGYLESGALTAEKFSGQLPETTTGELQTQQKRLKKLGFFTEKNLWKFGN